MSSKPLVARVKSAMRRLARRVALLLLVSFLAYATLRALARVQYSAPRTPSSDGFATTWASREGAPPSSP